MKIEWMLDALKKLAKEHKAQLIEKVKKELKYFPPRYLKLFDKIYNRFYSKTIPGRWYDPYHIGLTTLFAIYSVKKGESPEINIIKAAGHDIGYYIIENKEDWNSAHSRILHQQESAAKMARFLVESGDFSAEEIEKIVRDVGKHDNQLIGTGIPVRDPELFALIDADRSFVMHPLSFYKDWLSEIKKNEELSLLDLFRLRLLRFFSPDESTPIEWGKRESFSENLKSKVLSKMQLLPSTPLAKEWRMIHFRARHKEITNGIIRSQKIFYENLKAHIQSELEAGRC